MNNQPAILLPTTSASSSQVKAAVNGVRDEDGPAMKDPFAGVSLLNSDAKKYLEEWQDALNLLRSSGAFDGDETCGGRVTALENVLQAGEEKLEAIIEKFRQKVSENECAEFESSEIPTKIATTETAALQEETAQLLKELHEAMFRVRCNLFGGFSSQTLIGFVPPTLPLRRCRHLPDLAEALREEFGLFHRSWLPLRMREKFVLLEEGRGVSKRPDYNREFTTADFVFPAGGSISMAEYWANKCPRQAECVVRRKSNLNTVKVINESELLLPLLWRTEKMLPGIVLNGIQRYEIRSAVTQESRSRLDKDIEPRTEMYLVRNSPGPLVKGLRVDMAEQEHNKSVSQVFRFTVEPLQRQELERGKIIYEPFCEREAGFDVRLYYREPHYMTLACPWDADPFFAATASENAELFSHCHDDSTSSATSAATGSNTMELESGDGALKQTHQAGCALLSYPHEDIQACDELWLRVCEMLSSDKQGLHGCAQAAKASSSHANTNPQRALHSKVKLLWQPCHRPPAVGLFERQHCVASFRPDSRARTIVVCADEKSKTRVVELFGKCTSSFHRFGTKSYTRASINELLESVQKWCREDLKAIQTADSEAISSELKASWTDFFSCKSVCRTKGVGALPEDTARLRTSMKLQRDHPKCVTTTGASADSSCQEERTKQEAELIAQLQQLDEEIGCFLESITEFIAADKCHREALGGAYHQQDRWELMWELPEKDDSEDGEHGENEEEQNMEQNARKKKAAKKEEMADVELGKRLPMEALSKVVTFYDAPAPTPRATAAHRDSPRDTDSSKSWTNDRAAGSSSSSGDATSGSSASAFAAKAGASPSAPPSSTLMRSATGSVNDDAKIPLPFGEVTMRIYVPPEGYDRRREGSEFDSGADFESESDPDDSIYDFDYDNYYDDNDYGDPSMYW